MCPKILETHITELNNGITENSEKLTPDIIQQTTHSLYSVISRLKQIHNSTLQINKLNLDILYTIFALAIHSHPSDKNLPDSIVMKISHVCHHWRNSALGWPSLWRFININRNSSVIELFMKRSKESPLSLSWNVAARSSIPYLKSHANIIIPRLRSLNLCFVEDSVVSDIFKNSGLISLRHLDIHCAPARANTNLLTDFLSIDISDLQNLELENLNLPWLGLRDNKLTHLSLFERFPPLSQLLVFLSNCPLLTTLVLYSTREITITEKTSLEVPYIDKLDLPNLERLVLKSTNNSNFHYVSKLSARMGNLDRLSVFRWEHDNKDNYLGKKNAEFSFYDMLNSVPSVFFPHLARHHYVYVRISEQDCFFFIRSTPILYPEGTFDSYLCTSPHFQVSCQNSRCDLGETLLPGSDKLWDFAPILKFMHGMPEATYLGLDTDTWEFFTSSDINFKFRSAFPCLHTVDCFHFTERKIFTEFLNDLQVVKFKKLVLRQWNEDLLDVVLGIKIDTLELRLRSEWCAPDSDTVSILRQGGIDVVVVVRIRTTFPY